MVLPTTGVAGVGSALAHAAEAAAAAAEAGGGNGRTYRLHQKTRSKANPGGDVTRNRIILGDD